VGSRGASPRPASSEGSASVVPGLGPRPGKCAPPGPLTAAGACAYNAGVASDNPSVTVEPEAQPQVAPVSAASLDFDKAAYSTPVEPKTCAGCKRLIPSEYYEAGGQIICGGCRDQLVGTTGDRWAFWRALLYGGLAAAAGTVVWALIIHLTGYELGLIAIAVGIGVGLAVRKGSGGRGGWRYQTLAMVLTYLSITTSYVPIVVKGVLAGAKQKTAAAAVDGKQDKQGSPAIADEKPGELAQADVSSTPAGEQSSLPLPIALLAFVALVWGFALAAPFLGGTSNIMGLIIIAIGLYEAWKYNRALKVSGPFRLAPAAAPAAPVGTSPP
jgi:hypothetical protein